MTLINKSNESKIRITTSVLIYCDFYLESCYPTMGLCELTIAMLCLIYTRVVWLATADIHSTAFFSEQALRAPLNVPSWLRFTTYVSLLRCFTSHSLWIQSHLVAHQQHLTEALLVGLHLAGCTLTVLSTFIKLLRRLKSHVGAFSLSVI